MAENESLDLKQPGGLRWHHVRDAMRKGRSPEEVAVVFGRKLPAALRKAFKELLETGVSFKQFLDERHDPKALARFVRKCHGHDFAHLLANTAAMETGADDRQFVRSFLDGVVERVTDQVAQEVVGSAALPSFQKVEQFVSDLRQRLDDDLKRIESKLVKDPNWSPTIRRSKNGEKSNPTKEMLSMSLLGATKK